MDSSAETSAELRRRIRQQEVVADLGQRALETDDVGRLLRDAAVEVAETLEADYCEVLELLPGGDEFLLREGVGWNEGVVGAATVPTDRNSQAGYTLLTEEPVVVADLRSEDRFAGPDLLIDHEVSSGITAIVGSVDEPWGVLGVHTTEKREFSQQDATFVRGVANVLASAIENERSETELEEIYGRISDAFFALDEDWNFTFLNDRAHDLINPDGEELVGDNIWEAFPAATERKFEPQYERAMYEQETVSFEEYYPEPVDAWFEVRAYPSESGLSVYFRDVTERKERERALEERERQLSTLMDNVPGMVYRCRNERGWPMEFVSEASEDLTGYAPESLVDGDVGWGDDVMVQEDREMLWETVQRETGDGSTFTETYRIETADGDRRWVKDYGRGVFDDDGNLTHVEGIIEDVTTERARERELERMERRFEAVFEDPNILVGLLEPDGTVLDINETAMEYIDADLEAVRGEPFWETPWWGEGDDVGDDVREWTERAAGGEYVDFEADLSRPDGERYTLEGYFRPVTNDDGDVVSVIVSDRDVSERRAYRRRLEQSEQRYRALAENFPNGLVTLYDHDLRYTLAAGQGFEGLPVSGEEIEGQTVRDAWGDDVADDLEPLFRDALEGETGAVELSYVGRDWIVHAVPITDDDGDVFAGMTMAQDITERKEYQRQLEQSEQRYRTLAENFPNGAVGVYDRDLRYTLAEGAVLGESLPSADRLEGTRMPELFPPGTVGDLEPLFRAAVEDGVTNDTTTEFGGRNWRVWAAPLRDADGDIFAGLSFAQDITEQVERQRKLEDTVEMLEASNERLEQFAYAASHDLQEPLRMVSSYLKLIERRSEDELSAESREFLEFAVDGADRMREMIDALLQYSRVETQGAPLEPVDLNDVLADALADLERRIEETDAEITTEALPRVLCDDRQLRQVFENLLRNALTYSGDDPPRVHVSAERRDPPSAAEPGDSAANDAHKWVISVADEGIGIDPAEQERIFEVFQRLHGRDRYEGTGIGLALCQRIVERHGGEIWVDSEPGEGATFSFTLPAADDGN